MNAVHLHLITNHFPIIGVFFGLLVLVYGFNNKSKTSVLAAYWVFIIAAALGAVAYFSGHSAEHIVEDVPGILETAIEEHEESALITFIAMIVLAILSIIGVMKKNFNFNSMKILAVIILIVATVSLAIATYTGLLGGNIRHSEVRSEQKTS